MDSTIVFMLSFAIGIIAGLRSLTAPAAVSWAAYLAWISVQGTWLNFLSYAAAAYIFGVLALVELVTDKLSKTPSRKAAGPFGARIMFGAMSGAALTAAGHQSWIVGAALGGLGAVAGTLGGYAARTGLVKALKSPDWVVAVCEDVIAVGGGLFLVSRF